MAGRQPKTAMNHWGQKSLVVFGILIFIFIANILLGKADVVFGWGLSFLLSDVGEYLVLLFAALFFTIATLVREFRTEARDGAPDPDPDPASLSTVSKAEEDLRHE
ncbi:MAG: hypothetical protein ISR44_03280 [Rhodospirillales bacterium]|nr:hypothetical protein [Rhodospirillales bacterium]